MKLFRSIASLFLATLVVIASVGVTVNMHLCAGQVQSFALFEKAQPCKMEVKKSCHQVMKNGCCEEKSIVVKGKETNAEVKAATEINPSFTLVAVILPVLYSIIDVDSSVSSPRYAHYRPPLIERDITVLVQTFLI